MCDFVKIKETQKTRFRWVSTKHEHSSGQRRTDDQSNPELCFSFTFWRKSWEGKRKSNAKHSRHDYNPQRVWLRPSKTPIHFSRKMLRFLGSKTQALVLGKSTAVAFVVAPLSRVRRPSLKEVFLFLFISELFYFAKIAHFEKPGFCFLVNEALRGFKR